MRTPSFAVVTVVAAVAVLLLTGATAGVTTPENEPPLPDAGLDQEVTRGATVLLDGTESYDPDGDIQTHEWTIRTPDGTTTTPNCASCAETSFDPDETGRYRVTLTVTDDEGATRSDTLYVDVSPGADPEVSVSGEQDSTAGSEETYTASFETGAAALDYVVWTVDGTEIANRSLSADQSSDTVTKRFPTSGSRTITATVYDADGQSSTDSLQATVRSDSDPPAQSPDDSSKTGPDTAIADRVSPTVIGDEVVTGSEPLRGHYELQTDASENRIESVEWRTTADRVGTGRSLTRTWTPGDHEIYALVTYRDGSENVATFADDSTDVVADPRPEVSVDSLDRFGAISGEALGLDEYGNLETVRVEVGGDVVATTQPTRPGQRGNTDRQILRFSQSEFTPGERHRVTVVATDERGQVSETSTEIVPVKEPEIVRSEFVNGPVDSYHERIDPSRYTARHVLEIDLNGVDPENLTINHYSRKSVERVNHKSSRQSNYIEENDTIFVKTLWKADYPGNYDIDAEYIVENKQESWWKEDTSYFEVTPSKPELRLDVVNDGTKDYITREHGIVVDASDSFDPDKTELKYIWQYGAKPTKPDNTTAKFSAYERAASIVEDEHDLRTKRDFDFLEYFVPEIEETEVLDETPYYADETVRVRVKTEAYGLSKRTYYEDFELGLSVGHPDAKVIEWKAVEATDSSHSDATEDAYRYVGLLEIPASALSGGSSPPTIAVYNEENTQKEHEVELPTESVWEKDGQYWTNLTVSDMTYVVEEPEFDEVTVDSTDERNRYQRRGYSVEEKEQETEYALQERVKVQDAEYETETKTFDSRRMRDALLASQDEWYPGGTSEEEITRTEVDTEWRDSVKPKWRDSNRWNGEFTGQTRQKKVRPAEYQIEKQYEYDKEVEKTGTKTVTRTRTVSVRRTGTRTVTRCLDFGCYETTETYTYYDTETRTYTTTRSYTYTVTRTKTYWAPSKTDSDHRATGETRRVKLRDAVYETQYEIEEKSRYTDTKTVYEAQRDVLTQPAEYDWRPVETTGDRQHAYKKAQRDEDLRIGQTNTDTSWDLRKQTGSTRHEQATYTNESQVVETSAVVEGDVVQRYVRKDSGEERTKRVSEQTEEFTFDDVKDRWDILDRLRQPNINSRNQKLNR
ncbi:PKD domain-containing protein [Halorussus amylolyticus]|uniref:PKD domain-containing protein n=1 Tax=Halorussus amylolyticus TaxID=1126242 RepID=UPI001049B923|nr:PKD domain-containing protein [Halorussus amylolyticus]